MKTSEQTSSIFTALAAAQASMKSAAKDNTNPAFRSKYADLASHVEAIKPAFAAQKLAVVQELTSTDSGVDVTTRVCHASGEWIEFGPFCVPVSKHDAHGYGSACSYARRYALSAAVGTVADDDDGNAAAKAPYVAAVPDKPPTGYTEWADDMTTMATEVDINIFRDSYKASKRSYREFLETHDKPALDAMIARAKQNQPTAIPA